MPRNRRSLRTVVPLDSSLGNCEVACLIEVPLLDSGEGPDLVLTSDQWADVLSARRRCGRPLHFVETGFDAEEHCGHGLGASVQIDGAQDSEVKATGGGRGGHAVNAALPRLACTTMKRATLRGAA